MNICPNCGNHADEEVDYCPQCGNPLGCERPWEKINKPKPDAGRENPSGSSREPKVKHQVWEHNKRTRYLSTMEQEWYLEGETVVKVGYCAYTENPAEPEKLREGTAILTKNALLFGDSEHSIRCGKYILEIPLEVIVCVTDMVYRSKPSFLIRVNTGEQLIMYMMKKKEWQDAFDGLVDYRQGKFDTAEGETSVAAEKVSSGERWGKAILYLIGAVVFFIWSAYREGLLHFMFIFIACCCLFLVGVAIFAPKKLKR